MTCAEGLAGLRLVGPVGCMEALFFTPKQRESTSAGVTYQVCCLKENGQGKRRWALLDPLGGSCRGPGGGWVGPNLQAVVEVLGGASFGR